MATREEYNACMRPFITGKGRPREERKASFCVGAKVCSGKAKSKEDALELCAKSVPKGAKQALPKEEEKLACPARMSRVRDTIDTIILGLKSGDTEEMLPASAQVLNDVTECGTPETLQLASVAAQEVKGLAKRFYLKGEAKDAINQLEVLKELI
jgi:hypothetical protein